MEAKKAEKLTPEERKLIALFRRIRKESSKQAIPKKYLGHGSLPVGEAAAVLGVGSEEVRTRVGAWYPTLHPVSLEERVVPYSQVRRELERQHKERIRDLIDEAEHLMLPVWGGWLEAVLPPRDEFSVPEAARQLGVSADRVRRLIKRDGPCTIFARRGRVTQEEIQAFRATWGTSLKAKRGAA